MNKDLLHKHIKDYVQHLAQNAATSQTNKGERQERTIRKILVRSVGIFVKAEGLS